MLLDPQEQAVWNIVNTRSALLKSQLIDSLEEAVDTEKDYQSHYQHMQHTLQQLLEKGVLHENGDLITLAPSAPAKPDLTKNTLLALRKLRDQQLPLTLANLGQFMDVQEWVIGLFNWKLETPATPSENRMIDLDAVLDENTGFIELLFRRLGIDETQILNEGLIFGLIHQHSLKESVHSLLKQKILQFKIRHEYLKSSLEAKFDHQPPDATIRQLIEPVGSLSNSDIEKVIEAFESDFIKKQATEFLERVLQNQHSEKSQLQQRYPNLFSGTWEWDRLFYQLKQKVIQHARQSNMYQTPEEWKQLLKNKARSRFKQTQQKQGGFTSHPHNIFSASASLQQYYQMLGVNDAAESDEIRNAFRKLAKAHHPDQGGDPEFFRSLNKAYTELMNHLNA